MWVRDQARSLALSKPACNRGGLSGFSRKPMGFTNVGHWRVCGSVLAVTNKLRMPNVRKSLPPRQCRRKPAGEPDVHQRSCSAKRAACSADTAIPIVTCPGQQRLDIQRNNELVFEDNNELVFEDKDAERSRRGVGRASPCCSAPMLLIGPQPPPCTEVRLGRLRRRPSGCYVNSGMYRWLGGGDAVAYRGSDGQCALLNH